MRRQARLAAVAALVGVLVSGCGGNPKPRALPSESASPSASASASPSPPVLPEAAKAKSKAGAQATVRYFLGALAYAGSSGDTTAFRNAYAQSCTKCDAISKGIESTYQAGGSIKGGAWRLRNLKFYAIKNHVAYIDATVDYEPQVWTKTSTSEPQSSPARHNVLKAFQLVRKADHWAVGALDPET